MAHLFAISLGFIILATALPAAAQRVIFLDPNGPPTSDPAHVGYALDQHDLPFPMKWQEIKIGCASCQPLEAAYNKTMQSLLNTRYWIAEIEDRAQEIEQSSSRKRRRPAASPSPESTNEMNDRRETEALSYRLDLEDLAGRLPALHAQEDSLTSLAADLRAGLDDCAFKACGPAGPWPEIAAPRQDLFPLPFETRGPYRPLPTCAPCAALAGQLNDAPLSARVAAADMETALATLMFAEIELLSIRAEQEGIGLHATALYRQENNGQEPPPKYESTIESLRADYAKKSKKRIAEMEHNIRQAEKDINAHEGKLDGIAADFTGAMALYVECLGACKMHLPQSTPPAPELPTESTGEEQNIRTKL